MMNIPLAKILSALLAATAWAAAPTQMTYQGRLRESNAPVTGSRQVNIYLCDAPAAGTCTPTGEQAVTVTNSLFKTVFAVPSSVNLQSGTWYLEVRLGAGGTTTLSPREELTASPYSMVAGTATTVVDGVISSAKLAANAVASANIQDGAVTSAKLAEGAVSSGKIADGGVVSGKLASGSVATANILDGAVTSAKLGEGSVSSGKIADGGVATGKLADVSVASSKLQDLAVTFAKLADGAVASDKIQAGGIASGKLAAGAVLTANISDGAVTSAKLADGTVTSAKLADGSVSSGKIADGGVVSGKLAANAVATANVADGAVTSAKLAEGAVSSGKIADGGVATGKLADLSVASIKLQDSAVTFAKLADGAVASDKIQAGGIASGKLAANAVASANIEDGAVVTAKLAVGAVTTAKLAPEAFGPWQFLGRQKLGAGAGTISVSVPTVSYYKVIAYVQGKAGSAITGLRFNGDTGSSYAYSYIVNNSAPVTGTAASAIDLIAAGTNKEYLSFEVTGTPSGLVLVSGIATKDTGGVPDVYSYSGTYSSVSGVTSIDLYGGGQNLQPNSELIVYGRN